MTAAYQVAIASVAGVAITLQGQFMGLMDRTLGTKESVFVTYATGGVIAAFFMLAARGGNLRAWSAVPWYAFTAGILGLIIVGSVGYVVPRLGVAKAFTLIVATEFSHRGIDRSLWFLRCRNPSYRFRKVNRPVSDANRGMVGGPVAARCSGYASESSR